MENTNKMNFGFDLKKVLLERYEGAIVIDGLKGEQTINGKQLEPKRLTSFAGFSIPELITLNIKDEFFILLCIFSA